MIRGTRRPGGIMLLDVDALFTALDHKRRQARLAWRDVAEQAGISPSSFSRMGMDFRPPNAENLCRMLMWLGDTDVKPYIRDAFDDGVTL